MLDNRFALLFIRGERPVMDLKYDLLRHPAVRMTSDGKAPDFIHGIPMDARSSIELMWGTDLPEPIELPETSYELLSDEDVEIEVKKKEEEEENERKERQDD